MRKYDNGQVEYDYSGRVANVDKDDIGDALSSNRIFGYKAANCESLIFNTFEYDWNRTNKSLGSMAGWHIHGRMKYSNNWYAFTPSTNTETNSWKLPASGTKKRTSKGYIYTVGTYIF